MLVKLTESCKMGCRHCMESAVPDGKHMTPNTFNKTLEFIIRHNLMIIILSGGEPTDNPNFCDFVKEAKRVGLKTLVLSNGLFLQDGRKEEILSLDVPIQIINDPKYYPIKVELAEHKNIEIFDTKIMAPVSPHGRAAENNLAEKRMAPLCFNLRSATRTVGDFIQAVFYLRLKANKMCIPSITAKGDIVAGESRFCSKIGTVESSIEELTRNTINLKCRKCGLVDELSDFHKKVIGEV